jgi:hypothetical protein
MEFGFKAVLVAAGTDGGTKKEQKSLSPSFAVFSTTLFFSTAALGLDMG